MKFNCDNCPFGILDQSMTGGSDHYSCKIDDDVRVHEDDLNKGCRAEVEKLQKSKHNEFFAEEIAARPARDQKEKEWREYVENTKIENGIKKLIAIYGKEKVMKAFKKMYIFDDIESDANIIDEPFFME